MASLDYVRALRLACELWTESRDSDVADLVDTLAGYVDSEPPVVEEGGLEDVDLREVDSVSLGGWLTALEAGLPAIARRLDAILGTTDLVDPRMASLVATTLLETANNLTTSACQALLARLVWLGDRRVIGPLLEEATAPGPPLSLRAAIGRAVSDIEAGAGRAPRSYARLAAWQSRLRERPSTIMRAIFEEADDDAKQVLSDELTEIGHPYGELIALHLREDLAKKLSGAGDRRVASLLASHERRWLGRDLTRVLDARVYRRGVLDEACLRRYDRVDNRGAWLRAMGDARLATLRVLRPTTTERQGWRPPWPDAWGEPEAELISRAPLKRLARLEIPSDSFLSLIGSAPLPALEEVTLYRVTVDTMDRLERWADPSAARLPLLRRIVFRQVTEIGIRGLVELVESSALRPRLEELTLEPMWWYSGLRDDERDPTLWLRLLLDARVAPRASLRLPGVGALTVDRGGEELSVVIETDDGGEIFGAIELLPRIDRFELRDRPSEKAKRLRKAGVLLRALERTAPSRVVMPTRWAHQLTRLRAHPDLIDDDEPLSEPSSDDEPST